jgi:cellulose synthase/poly-beta-1,6-N-acetylglucosamine synthase-like glycosyltransferase
MSAAIQPSWCVGVVVPAQNEAATIERCITSVLAAHDNCGVRTQLWMVVVADLCTDDTARLARRALGAHGEVVECASRSPGTARRLGVDSVLRHFSATPADRIWIANTDADTHVPPDWLQRHLEHADADAGGVAGIVQFAPDGLRTDVQMLYEATYEVRGDGTHGHVHGANLGVRGDAYLDVGGWSHASVSEDHCLWGRLQRRGWSLRSCAKTVVTTSARLHGRAIGGFADTLRARVEPDLG